MVRDATSISRKRIVREQKRMMNPVLLPERDAVLVVLENPLEEFGVVEQLGRVVRIEPDEDDLRALDGLTLARNGLSRKKPSQLERRVDPVLIHRAHAPMARGAIGRSCWQGRPAMSHGLGKDRVPRRAGSNRLRGVGSADGNDAAPVASAKIGGRLHTYPVTGYPGIESGAKEE